MIQRMQNSMMQAESDPNDGEVNLGKEQGKTQD